MGVHQRQGWGVKKIRKKLSNKSDKVVKQKSQKVVKKIRMEEDLCLESHSDIAGVSLGDIGTLSLQRGGLSVTKCHAWYIKMTSRARLEHPRIRTTSRVGLPGRPPG